MKLLPSLLCGVLFASFTALAAAQDPSTLTAENKFRPAKWNVSVEVLMVALSEDKFLALLPQLRDPEKIDAATAELLAAVQRREAILTGYPIVSLEDGQRALAETTYERRYPTGFTLPESIPAKGAPDTKQPADSTLIDESAFPTEFETRHTGVNFEVEAHVRNAGESIWLQVYPQRVELLRYDAFNAIAATGGSVKIEQPQFFSTKVQTTLVVRNGARRLIAVHSLLKPEHYLEVFILQATASTIKGNHRVPPEE